MTVIERLKKVQDQLQQAIASAHRQTDNVHLIAVSKTKSADDIRLAYKAGQRDFGESYVQEVMEKLPLLQDLAIVWHFIGPIQSNKTKFIAEHFDWVHSVDRLKIAKRLSAQRPGHLPPLKICLQVNIDQEASKSGFNPEAVAGVLDEVMALPNIDCQGLMAIPAKQHLDQSGPNAFERLAQLQKQFIERGYALPHLSMGMSQDFDAAIAAGATWVRVGTGVFGKRG